MGLKLEHVSYLYGTDTELLVRALDDVNLEIPDGQFIGLIGHTGSLRHAPMGEPREENGCR